MTISMETVHMAKSQPRKNQLEHLDLPQDYLANIINQLNYSLFTDIS